MNTSATIMPKRRLLAARARSEDRARVAAPLFTEALIDPFTEWLRSQGRSLATRRIYKARAGLFLRWLDGRHPTVPLLCEYRDYLMTEHQAEGEEHAGLRPRTVRAIFCAVRALLKFAEAECGVTDMPNHALVKLPPVDLAQRTVPTEQDVKALFDAAGKLGDKHTNRKYGRFTSARAKAVLALAAQCGLRRDEMLNLAVSDIREIDGGRSVCVRKGKGGTTRFVPISGETVEILDAYLALRADRIVNKHRGEDCGALLVDFRGKKASHHTMESVFQRCSEIAGITERNITPHCLRHACASFLLRQGVDIKTVSVILGHSDIKTTMNVYCHTNAAEMRKATEALSERLYGAGPKPLMQSRPSTRGERLQPRRTLRRAA